LDGGECEWEGRVVSRKTQEGLKKIVTCDCFAKILSRNRASVASRGEETVGRGGAWSLVLNTHRPRGSLDGPDPVEDVIPVRKRADARVRFGLRGEGWARGYEWGGGGSVTGKHGFAERANARRVGGNCVRFGWNDAVEVAC
jgi:hypothetical protein